MGYLIGKGADVNAVNLYGDSPLERASANHRMDVVQVLSEHGGKDLKGDAEQRDRASKEIVHRDIEEMNSGQEVNGCETLPCFLPDTISDALLGDLATGLRAIADALDARKLDGKFVSASAAAGGRHDDRLHLRIVLDVAAPIIQTIALDGSTLKLDDQS